MRHTCHQYHHYQHHIDQSFPVAFPDAPRSTRHNRILSVIKLLGFWLHLFFELEGEGDMFLRKFDELLPNYMALYPRILSRVLVTIDGVWIDE
jgi:hypothetical protein